MTWRVNFVRSKDAQKQLARTSLSFVPPRKNTNKQTDVSVQPTGKWIERINQSERTLS